MADKNRTYGTLVNPLSWCNMLLVKFYIFATLLFVLNVSSHYQPLIREGSGDVTASSPIFSKGTQGLLEPIPVISLGERYTLDESPAHRRALTDGKGRHARRISSNFGVQYLAQGYFNMQLSRTSDLAITSRPALPTELQSPCFKSISFKTSYAAV